MATRKQLEEALRLVREVNGSPDIIAALLSALERETDDDAADRD